MSKIVAYLLTASGAFGLVIAALCALLAFGYVDSTTWRVLSKPEFPSADLQIQVEDPGTGEGDAPETVDFAQFIVSERVLASVAEKFAPAFPDLTTEQVVAKLKERLHVTSPESGVYHIDSELDPIPLGTNVLAEVVAVIPDKLEAALWPNGKDQRRNYDSLSASRDELTTRVAKLEREYRKLQETTPVIVENGGEVQIPKVLSDKRKELAAAREDLENTITAFANETLKPNYRLQFKVLRMPSNVAVVGDARTAR